MAGPLTAVERFFERMFERPAARLFQAKVEPVNLQRSIERALESERRVVSRRTYAPNAYRVLLNASDLDALDGDRFALTRDLADCVRAYARARGYTLVARPALQIEPSVAVQPGDVRVFAQPFVVPPSESERPAPPPKVSPIATAAPNGKEATDSHVLGPATSVFAAPSAAAPRAQLAVRSPGRSVERFLIRPGAIRIGRSLDNDVVLADDRVSRHHGKFSVRLGMLVYTDMGSTNGSFLNGSAVTEIALGPGDVLQLGRSTVTIEPAT